MPDYKKIVFDSLLHRENKRVPYFFDYTPPARKKLENYYNIDNKLDEILNLPIIWGGPESIKPIYANPEKCGQYLKD